MKKLLLLLTVLTFSVIGAFAETDDSEVFLVTDKTTISGGVREVRIDGLCSTEKAKHTGSRKFKVTIPATLIIGGQKYRVVRITDNAFNPGWEGYTKIDTVDMSAASYLREIGSYAFGSSNYEMSVNKVIFPKNGHLEKIEDHAFKRCSLSSVELPGSVTTIQDNAFEKSGLREFTINSNISFRNDCFLGCDNLNTVTINNNDFVSKNYTSSNNISKIFPNLKFLNLGTSVTKIGDYAFNKGKFAAPNELYITKSTDGLEIGNRAFQYWEDVTFAFKPTIIGSYAFGPFSEVSNYSPHINVDFSEVTSVGDYAFLDCTIRVADLSKCTSFGVGAFVFDHSVSLSSHKTIRDLYISTRCPFSFDGRTITNLHIVSKDLADNSEYSKYRNLSNLIPSGANNIYFEGDVLWVSHYALYGNTNIKTVHFGPSVKDVSSNAFQNCSNLQTVEVKGETSLSESSFEGCTSLSVINVTKVDYFGKKCFYGCTSLETVNANARFYGESCFGGCNKITSVTLGSNTESIGTACFLGCDALQKVTVSNEAKNYIIGTSAFSDIKTLTTVDAYGASTVKENSFKGCTALTSVKMNQVKMIYNEAFYNCSSLNFFLGSSAITSIEYIGDRAFCNTKTVAGSDLANQSELTSIGAYAFWNAGGNRVDLPAKVRYLGEKAFNNTQFAIVRSPIGSYAIDKLGLVNGSFLFIGDNDTNVWNIDQWEFVHKGSDTLKLAGIYIRDNVGIIPYCAFGGVLAHSVVIGKNANFSDIKGNHLLCYGTLTINNPAVLSKTYTTSENLYSVFGMQFKKLVVNKVNESDVLVCSANAFYNTSLSDESLLEEVQGKWNRIEESAFYFNRNLRSIDLSEVSFIGDYALSACDLRIVSIGNNIDDEITVGGYVFDANDNMEIFEINSENVTLNSSNSIDGRNLRCLVDMTDKLDCRNMDPSRVKIITNTEARASEYRNSTNRYRATSLKRMECEPADVNMDNKTTGDDAQAVYNSMK